MTIYDENTTLISQLVGDGRLTQQQVVGLPQLMRDLASGAVNFPSLLLQVDTPLKILCTQCK